MAKKAKDKIGFWEYAIDTSMEPAERGAAFLMWCATTFPGRPVPLEHIARVVFVTKRLPKEDGADCQSMRSRRMAAIKRLVRDVHKREVVYHPGFGYRATVNDEDTARTALESKRRRVEGAIDSMNATRGIIDTKAIKNRNVRDRVEEIDDALKRLNAPAIRGRLAPPSEGDEE